MKPRNLYRIIIGIILILGALGTILMSTGESVAGTLMLTAGIAFLVTGVLRHRRYGDDPETDERSKKIGAYGLSLSWLTGLFFMAGLFWLDYLGIVRLGSQLALTISILVLALSAVIFQMYLFRKGDTD